MRGLASLRSLAPRLLLIASIAGCGGGGDPVEPPPPPPPPTASAVAASSGAAAQTATVGTAVAAAPAVRVTSSAGQPMSGVAVAFAVTAGGGTLGATAATTNAQGIASAGSWTLGTTAGANAVRATVGSLTPVTFEATGTAGAVASLALVSGGGQDGWTEEALAQPIVVKAADAHGNAVPNTVIAFATVAEHGAPSAAQATTGASGEAQVTWTLGATEGAQSIMASAGTANVGATATAAFPLLRAHRISVGWAGAQCAISEQGALSCWGRNDFGTLGDGTTTYRATPVPIGATFGTIADVALGTSHGCLLTTAGTAYCWGTSGTVGDGTLESRGTPTAVAGGHVFSAIEAGNTATCALTSDGTAYCWGYRGSAEHSSITRQPALVSATLRFTDLAVGNNDICGATGAGTTYCWSIWGLAPLSSPSEQPVPIIGSEGLVSVTAGERHTCGLTADGAAFCWGLNGRGEVGDGTTTDRDAATAVAGGHRFLALDAGRTHTCGTTESGATYCWGRNDGGQLGNNELTNGPTSAPVRVVDPLDVGFVRVSAGFGQTCAATAADVVYCWGTLSSANAESTVVPIATRVRAR